MDLSDTVLISRLLNRYADRRNRATRGIGDGPQLATIRASINTVKTSKLWGELNGFYRPLLYTVPAHPPRERVAQLWAYGALMAIHLVVASLGPDPVSPWILYACIFGTFDHIDPELIHYLDPTAAEVLRPWFAFTSSDTFAALDYFHPVRQLLVTYLDISDVSLSSLPALIVHRLTLL